MSPSFVQRHLPEWTPQKQAENDWLYEHRNKLAPNELWERWNFMEYRSAVQRGAATPVLLDTVVTGLDRCGICGWPLESPPTTVSSGVGCRNENCPGKKQPVGVTPKEGRGTAQ